MKISEYEVKVVAGNSPVREFYHNVNNETKCFIESRFGSEYKIVVKNNGCKKVLAIIGIDGLNCVTGDKSDGYSGRGYIIPAYSSREITGWRISDDSVSAFKFDRKDKGYAASQGMAENSGIISVNIISEKEVKTQLPEINWDKYEKSAPEIPIKPWHDPYPYSPFYKSYDVTYDVICGDSSIPPTINYMCSLSSNVSETKGTSLDSSTSWGDQKEDKIKRVGFDKDKIVSSFNIFYSTRRTLEKMGIVFTKTKEIDLPSGFTGGYCKIPTNWRG